MNKEWIRKNNQITAIEKSKNHCQNAACQRKTNSKKENFFQTVLILYFKLRLHKKLNKNFLKIFNKIANCIQKRLKLVILKSYN